MADKTVYDRDVTDLLGNPVPQTYGDLGNGTWGPTDGPSAGEGHLGEVGGTTTTVADTFARSTGNITGYTALDVVGPNPTAVRTFANIARKVGGSGYITGVRLMTDQKTNTVGYRLHLYHTAPIGIADNDPFLLLWANRDKRVGSIDIPNLRTEDATNSTGASNHNFDIRVPFICDPASQSLYYILETLVAFTPADGQSWFVELTAESN